MKGLRSRPPTSTTCTGNSGERRRKELRVDLMTSGVAEEVAGGNVGR